MVAHLFATFELARTGSDVTDALIGTLTGPFLFGDVKQIENDAVGTKYQFVANYIAGSDMILEYSIFRKTFTRGASVEVDTVYATNGGISKATYIIPVSDTPTTVTYDIILITVQ